MSIINEKELRNRIKNSKYEKIELNIKPYDVCILPNGFILTANRADGTLTIFDSTFKLQQTIDKIDNKDFKPRGITVNNRHKQIYILDELNSQIIMTDLQFKKLESYGSYGSSDSQFDDPASICHESDFLYVSDRNNQKVKVLTDDLEFSNSIELDYKPYLIKASNKRLCVTCVEKTNERGLYFYDLDSFQLQQRYEHSIGKISEINSHFYLLCCESKMLYCYNTDGVFIKEINVERLGEFLIDLYDGNLFYLNQNLIVTSYRSKKFLKF
jgi:6-phosphogluconolactonase (cycloisomerase 2 family)